ncbi:2-dehydropantoate 2-reductase [Comamonas phosphati]|nr:2-dehydropantoate 2-reductase [Comamonas phosphati]
MTLSSTDPQAPTRIAVMGAGAVGCYYGGMLARAGRSVVLIGRPAHMQAVQRHGLRLQTRSFDERIRLEASCDAATAAGAQLVLLSVKSTDTEAAAEQLRPHLAPDALIITLQNGVDNARRLRTALPNQAVAASVVYVAVEMAGPGHVCHHGRGELLLEPSPASAAAADLLNTAGVPTEISTDVEAALWTKLIINCAYNALSAIARQPYGPLVQQNGVTQVMDDVVSECLAVARAENVVLAEPRIREAVHGLARSMPAQYSSTAQDLMRGRSTEIDHLNGHIVRRGAVHGIPTPANRVLHTLVHLVQHQNMPKPSQD